MQVGTAQVLCADFLTNGSLDQRRATQKDGALLLDNDALVGHGRHVRTACRAGTHDGRDLRNAFRRHVGLVEEDTTEMLAVGKHVSLARQIRTSRIHFLSRVCMSVAKIKNSRS